MLIKVYADSTPARLDRPEGLTPAFGYFAAELFNTTHEEVQQVLLKTALLRRFTADIAVAASGNEWAGRILEDLYRRRLFVERRPAPEPTYQYHDLFRASLRSRGEPGTLRSPLHSSCASRRLSWKVVAVLPAMQAWHGSISGTIVGETM